jgi:integrase
LLGGAGLVVFGIKRNAVIAGGVVFESDAAFAWGPVQLARVCDDAMRDRLIASNPARGVKLPKLPPSRNVYLTAAQLQMLADECGRYKSLVLAMGVGGLRLGEAAALRVSDVDFLRRRVELRRNAVKVAIRSWSAHSRVTKTVVSCSRRLSSTRSPAHARVKAATT